MQNVIIYLIGYPGVGKYTIAQEISNIDSNYIICDNQLVNNPIYSLLRYDGFIEIPKFAEDIIDKIRENIFEFIIHETQKNYILTNFLSEDGKHILYKKVIKMAETRNSVFIPIKLHVAREEHQKRIVNQNRLLRYKSIDIKYTSLNTKLIDISHPNLLELDITNLSVQKSAQIILLHVKNTITQN